MKTNIFNKIYTKLFFVSLSIFGFLGMLFKSMNIARAGYGLEETQSAAKLPQGDIPTFLGRFAGAGLALSGSIFLFLIVYGGIIIMTAAGKEDKVNKGKTIITWAIIGALILGGAYAITNLVFQAFTDIETPTNVNS